MQQDVDQIGKNPANAAARSDMDLLSPISVDVWDTRMCAVAAYRAYTSMHEASPEDLSVCTTILKNGGLLSPEQRANFLHLAQTR